MVNVGSRKFSFFYALFCAHLYIYMIIYVLRSQYIRSQTIVRSYSYTYMLSDSPNTDPQYWLITLFLTAFYCYAVNSVYGLLYFLTCLLACMCILKKGNYLYELFLGNNIRFCARQDVHHNRLSSSGVGTAEAGMKFTKVGLNFGLSRT